MLILILELNQILGLRMGTLKPKVNLENCKYKQNFIV